MFIHTWNIFIKQRASLYPKTYSLELYSDILSFIRKLRLQYLVHDKPRKDKQPFQPKPKYNPGVTQNNGLETIYHREAKNRINQP